MPATEQIRSKISQIPHKPGIYLMKDRFGTVIYVGKARDLRKRVHQYFHPSRRHGWDLKLIALVEAVHDLDVHVVRTEPEAVLLEGKLIKEFHPRYNVSFRDDKHFLLLKVNLRDQIPRFALTRLKQDDGAQYFGPFASSGALRRTVALIRQKFNLRGCRPLLPNDRDYKHCLYANLKYCTAPCIGNVSRDDYLLQIQAACDFLSGQSQEMETELETAMKKASANLEFERAAELRDMLSDLKKTTQKTNKFVRIPYKLPVALNPDEDLIELVRVLGLPNPPYRIEGFDISNISGTFAVASMVSFRNGRPDRANYRRFRIKSVTGQDDFACMAETIRRRYTRLLKDSTQGIKSSKEKSSSQPAEREEKLELTPDAANDHNGGSADETNALPAANAVFPNLILIDGGKGQLNAACAELEKLGLGHLSAIGLAKEFEEIYQPGEREPLRLSHESGALKLLQRVRDESHRFANTYSAQLRLRRISESVLDEFPGIGERRKGALLRKFGSVQRLRMATVEQIAEVPGFGGKIAAELRAFIEARSIGES